jgi:hypothetical protein
VPDDADAFERRPKVGPPRFEQVADHGEEVLLRRIPRFHQVVIELDVVDRPDRRLGVGVGGQQDPPRLGDQLAQFRQELDPGHAGHPLVDEEERDRLLALHQPLRRAERDARRIGRQDTVVATEATAQIALHGPQHLRVVVDRHQDRVCHQRWFFLAVRRRRSGPVRHGHADARDR